MEAEGLFADQFFTTITDTECVHDREPEQNRVASYWQIITDWHMLLYNAAR